MSDRLVRLLHAASAGPAGGPADADLLGRVAAGKDDAAFELLVRRHADMVWRACRAVAGDHHAAEDAFQATFLALATRAGAVRGNVPGWLHRVAVHAALKARPRRREVPLTAEPSDRGGQPHGSFDPDAGAVLHAELGRLPDNLRAPLVLCYLEGFTQAEAARRLGWPLGTVATRVRRGSDRLRRRLAGRGVALPAGGAAGLLCPADGAAVPAGLIPVTACLGHGAAPAPAVARLAQGAVFAMSRTKILATLAAAVAGGLGLAVTWAQTPADPPKPAAAARRKPGGEPSTFAQRERSRDNLRRVGLAVHAYCDAHADAMPADILGKDGKPLLSWRVALLPYLDQDYLYSQFKLDEPWDSGHNRKLLPHMPKVFRSPVPIPGRETDTLVQGFAGQAAGFPSGKKVALPDDFPDGTSNTVLVAEAGPGVPWTKPTDRPYDPNTPLPAMDGPYADRFLAVFADGSVWDIRWNLPAATYRRLVERADGYVIPDGVEAPPPPPVDEADRKAVERARKRVADRAAYLARWEGRRQEVLAELRKTGGVPAPAAPGPDAGVEEWREVEARLGRQERVLMDDLTRLERELKRRQEQKK